MFKILGRLIYKLLNVEVRYRGNWQKDNKWLIDKNFKTIIDVGANTGQFAQKMRKFFPDATIISFEPISQVYEQLKKNFKNDPLFIAHNCALGERAGTAEFFTNENSESSSLLKMKDHTSHFSKAKETTAIQVNICRLDDVLNVADLKGPVMVKLDVQGYEDMVKRELNLMQMRKGNGLYYQAFKMVFSSKKYISYLIKKYLLSKRH